MRIPWIFSTRKKKVCVCVCTYKSGISQTSQNLDLKQKDTKLKMVRAHSSFWLPWKGLWLLLPRFSELFHIPDPSSVPSSTAPSTVWTTLWPYQQLCILLKWVNLISVAFNQRTVSGTSPFPICYPPKETGGDRERKRTKDALKQITRHNITPESSI